MDLVTRVQIEAVCISYSANTFGKSINPTILLPAKGKIVGQTGLLVLVWHFYHTSSLKHRNGSSVMFPLGSQGVSGLATSDPLAQMTQQADNLRIHTRQMTSEMALSPLIFQQSIRARLLWWLLNLAFKIGRPLCSCFPAAMTDVIIRLFVQFGM